MSGSPRAPPWNSQQHSSCQLATICLRVLDIDQSVKRNRAFNMMQSRGRPNRVTKPTTAVRRPNRRIDEDQLTQHFSTSDEDSDLYQAVHRAATAAANAEAQQHHAGVHDGVMGDAGDEYKVEQGQEEEDGDADADLDPEHGHESHLDVMDHDMPMAPMDPDQHHHADHEHHHHQAIELPPPELLEAADGLAYVAVAAGLRSPGPPPPPVGSTMPAPQPLVAATDFQPHPPPPPPPPSSHVQPPSQQPPPHPLAALVSSQPSHKTTEQMAHESGYSGFKVDSAFAKRMARDPGQRLAEQRRHGQDLNLVRRSNVEALFAQIAGSEAANPCAHCRKGQGPWTVCVVYSGQMMGSCANCWFNASGSRCSFHGTLQYCMNSALVNDFVNFNRVLTLPEEKSQPVQPAQHPYATVPVPVPIPSAHPSSEQIGGGYAPGASPAQLQAAALWNASVGLFSHDAGVKGTVQNALLQVRQATPYQRALIEVEVAAKQLALKIVAAEELATTMVGDEGDIEDGQQHHPEYDSPPGLDDGDS